MEKEQSNRPMPPGISATQYRENQLLRLMTPGVRDRLRASFEIVREERGSVLIEPGDETTHAYFPLGGTVVSYVIPMQDGRGIEAASVGREGSIGGIASAGAYPFFARAVVRMPGEIARIPSARLEEVKREHPALHDLLSRYIDCFIAQVLQSAACASVHSLEARYARWLLLMQDRIQADDLPLTQEALAEMFGVARSWVTRVSTSLQDRGMISYRRGVVHIADRAALADASCECYALVRQHFDRLAPGLYPDLEP